MRVSNISIADEDGVSTYTLKASTKKENCVFDQIPLDILKDLRDHLNQKIEDRPLRNILPSLPEILK